MWGNPPYWCFISFFSVIPCGFKTFHFRSHWSHFPPQQCRCFLSSSSTDSTHCPGISQVLSLQPVGHPVALCSASATQDWAVSPEAQPESCFWFLACPAAYFWDYVFHTYTKSNISAHLAPEFFMQAQIYPESRWESLQHESAISASHITMFSTFCA